MLCWGHSSPGGQCCFAANSFIVSGSPSNPMLGGGQRWHLQKSASGDGVKIELRSVLAQFKANLSFPTPGMLLSGLTLKRCEPPKVSIVLKPCNFMAMHGRPWSI